MTTPVRPDTPLEQLRTFGLPTDPTALLVRLDPSVVTAPCPVVLPPVTIAKDLPDDVAAVLISDRRIVAVIKV